MNGTAAVGTSSGLAREDHVHPFDTACVPTTRKINGLDLTADRNLTYANVGAASTVHSSPQRIRMEGALPLRMVM